jgi:cell wall-associated NlpC family hydrolase
LNRDLGDERLWRASHHRSIDRRHAATIRRRTPIARTKTAGVALVIGAGAVPALGTAVSPASADDGLAAVQQALGVKADGVMGPETRKALRRFQRKHHLPAVGLAGPRTRAALGLDGDAPQAATGTRRATLRDVQSKLGLDADGVAGPKTRAAIRDFQRENSLDVTGRLDPKTRSAIMGSQTTSAATPRSAPSEDTAAPAQTSGVSAAVDAAREQIGKPYQSAGKGPGGFDCSGLTAFAFRAAGISLGSSSYAQYGQGTSISKSEIQAGDLVFFNSNGSGASHVGIATGPTTMISATSHGVMENSFTSGYWASHYVGARRVTSS